uniref:Sulfotransferase family 4A member 1 n=1 Tax=Ovis aries TaxID=9940 RepID=A0AC11AME1_SHEEP
MAESEAETPSTPGEFESKYFEFHGVRLPPFCRGKMEEIANFPVRPSDVWIVTYPKSGTSLLQEVVYLVSQGADPDEIGLMNIDEQLPVLEYPQPGLDIIKELTSPRLIKSHLPYRFLPSDLHNGDSKVIYMARNPKDLVVSYYQFHRSLRTMSYRGTFQEFCRRFMNDKLGYGSWFEHVQEFWEHHMDSNVLFLKYEDMHRDLVAMVEQLARFLGVSCDKAQLESLVEHCHQLVDQCCNAEALPVGRVLRLLCFVTLGCDLLQKPPFRLTRVVKKCQEHTACTDASSAVCFYHRLPWFCFISVLRFCFLLAHCLFARKTSLRW